MPGIIEGAAQGKGRGRQVVAVAKTADLVLMLLDSTKSEKQKELLERELHEVGIRFNRQRPNIYFKVCLYAQLYIYISIYIYVYKYLGVVD